MVEPCRSPANLACVFITIAIAVFSIIYIRNCKVIEATTSINCSVRVGIQFGLIRLDAQGPMSL